MADDAPIIVRKVKKVVAGGHHGGQWKVAYADFVTAMMAFFLLMWLINTTSPQQKRGIADYFAPAAVSETTSGSGGILGGAALSSEGSKSTGSKDVIQQLAPDAPQDVTDAGQSQTTSHEGSQGTDTKSDEAALTSAAQSLRQAMQDMPELAELSKQIIVDQTPEGLRIQLVDQEGRSMFNEGSAVPNDRAKVLLAAVSKVVRQLPNRVTIAGHTSATPGGAKPAGDWAPVVRPRRRGLRPAAVERRRSGPNLPGGRQGLVRPALSRRPAAARQPSDHDNVATGSASVAVRRRPLD